MSSTSIKDMQLCAVLLLGSRQRTHFSLRLTTSDFVPHGPYFSMEVGPHNTITGTLKYEAKCMTPLSWTRAQEHFLSTKANCLKLLSALYALSTPGNYRECVARTPSI